MDKTGIAPTGRPPDLSVSPDPGVYYRLGYWNELEPVRRHLNTLLSGDPDRNWLEHLGQAFGGRVFARALVLNCGSGHIERALLGAGLVREAVGIDVSEELLDAARRAAAATGASIRYHRMDVNEAAFPGGGYDLVVNYAAAHHIRFLDRVFRSLCRLLPADGCFYGFDYIGPRRNQYPWSQWEAVLELNRTLPPSLRQELRYPHEPTMLVDDPTEAIHSSLIRETLERYFEVVAWKDLGGALAYPILTFNQALFAAAPAARDPWIERVLAADLAYLEENPGATHFAWYLARPRRAALADAARLAAWEREECDRERAAEAAGGRYGEPTPLQELTEELADLHLARQHLTRDLHRTTDRLEAERRRRGDLEEHLQRIQESRAYRLARRLQRAAAALRRLGGRSSR